MVMVGCLIAILARSCWHLAVAAVKLPALLCCDAMLSTVAFLTFPLRLLAAVDRERKAKLALVFLEIFSCCFCGS
jgi:hypothetical protein